MRGSHYSASQIGVKGGAMSDAEVRIEAVAAEADVARFLALPDLVYAGDRHYCRPVASTVRAGLFRDAFRDHQCLLLAWQGATPVARLCARLASDLRDAGGRPYGLLGFFEACPDSAAVAQLLAEGVRRLKAMGAGEIIGPMDGDTWHRYRFNLGPFDRPPFMMEPYNPPYYEALWLAAEFQPLEDYYSSTVTNIAAAESGTAGIAARAMARGYRLRVLDPARFEDELGVLYALTCRIFARNFLYSPISKADFFELYAGARRLIDPAGVLFACAPSGEAIGFAFAFPDRFAALAAMRGRRSIASRLRFLLAARRVDTLDIKTLGVLPEYQRTGVALLLMHRLYALARERGYGRVNLCLIREGNSSGRMDGGQGVLLRRYRLYRFGEAGAPPGEIP